MPNLNSVSTGYFPVNSETYSSTLSSSIGAGVATVPVASASPYVDNDYVCLTVDAGTVNQATFHGQKSGSSFINCVWTEGATGVGHAAGATIQDYDSATHFGVVTKGLRTEHNQNGTHKDTLVAMLAGAQTFTGVKTFSAAPLLPVNTVQPEDLVSGAGTSWAWQTWTPTWTNLTVGNGVVTGRYIQIGKTVVFRLSLVWGTTTSMSGIITVSLPVTAVSYPGTAATFHIASFTALDSGTATHMGVGTYNSTTTMLPKSMSTTLSGGINATTPFTWATNDEMHFNGTYEAA